MWTSPGTTRPCYKVQKGCDQRQNRLDASLPAPPRESWIWLVRSLHPRRTCIGMQVNVLAIRPCDCTAHEDENSQTRCFATSSFQSVLTSKWEIFGGAPWRAARPRNEPCALQYGEAILGGNCGATISTQPPHGVLHAGLDQPRLSNLAMKRIHEGLREVDQHSNEWAIRRFR